jgi:hypothetical protein
VTWDEVVAVGLKLPGVEVSTSYGTPSLKAYGKVLTRLRPEDDSLVLVGVGFDERDFLMEAEPAVFHITAHYKDYPSVLARIAQVDPGTVAQLFERRWRAVAPKRAVKAWDAGIAADGASNPA